MEGTGFGVQGHMNHLANRTLSEIKPAGWMLNLCVAEVLHVFVTCWLAGHLEAVEFHG